MLSSPGLLMFVQRFKFTFNLMQIILDDVMEAENLAHKDGRWQEEKISKHLQLHFKKVDI